MEDVRSCQDSKLYILLEGKQQQDAAMRRRTLTVRFQIVLSGLPASVFLTCRKWPWHRAHVKHA